MAQVFALKKIDPLEKLVLLAVADYSDDNGRSWPSMAKLAEKSNLSESTVRRRLRSAEESGLLKLVAREDKTGRTTSYVFYLFPEKNSQGGGCQPDRGEGVSLTPSFLNHQLEPSTKNLVALPSVAATVADASPKKGKAVSPAASRQHRWLVAWYCWAFCQVTGEPYLFSKADGKILADLLKSAGIGGVLERASYWLMDDDRFPRGSPTLKGLLAGWNRLAGRDGTPAACQLGILPEPGTNLNEFTPWKDRP